MADSTRRTSIQTELTDVHDGVEAARDEPPGSPGGFIRKIGGVIGVVLAIAYFVAEIVLTLWDMIGQWRSGPGGQIQVLLFVLFVICIGPVDKAFQRLSSGGKFAVALCLILAMGVVVYIKSIKPYIEYIQPMS